MRKFFIVVLVLLTNVVTIGQSSNPGPPAEATRGGGQAETAGTVKTAPRDPGLEATLAAAHEKLERGHPQEAIATLEKLAATSAASAK
jgi:hypothetical protein